MIDPNDYKPIVDAITAGAGKIASELSTIAFFLLIIAVNSCNGCK